MCKHETNTMIAQVKPRDIFSQRQGNAAAKLTLGYRFWHGIINTVHQVSDLNLELFAIDHVFRRV